MLDRPARNVNDIAFQAFTVQYEFPVYFTKCVFSPHNPSFLDALRYREPDKRHRFIAFIDGGVLQAMPDLPQQIAAYAATHADHLHMIDAPVVIDGGEVCKNSPDAIPDMLATLSRLGVDRHSYVIAIGGGAVLDAVGFAAAIFHRGVRHVRLPTTVLAQDDSGIGVKNAVNQFGQKNLIGTFAPPWAVINDSDFVNCLPPREKRAGMAEAVKVALIRDGDLFDWLETNAAALASFSPGHLDRLIRTSAELHMRQIRSGGDPFEMGSARPLDFGHWAAHRLEGLTHHALNHGEAVAIGIALDTRYSVLSGRLAPGADDRVARLLERLGFRLWDEALSTADATGRLLLLKGLAEFREHLGGELTITLLTDIGKGVEVHEMDEDLILQSIDWLERRAGGQPQ